MVLFLGLRTGIVAGLLVPITILVTIVVMSLMEIPLQKVSIAAIIIALGLLVDNGIVVAEDYLTRVSQGQQPFAAATTAGSKMMVPLLTASLTTIFAFYPLMAGDNVTIEYTRSLAQVITITLLSSWLVALTIIPLLAIVADQGAENLRWRN